MTGDSIPDADWAIIAAACEAIRAGDTTIIREIERHDLALWELEFQPGETA